METKLTKKQHLFGLIVFWLIPTVIMVVYAYARRMPYLLNMHNIWVYISFILIMTLVISVYVVFFHRWKDPNLNSEVMRFGKKNKAKTVLALLSASAMLVWQSWGLVGLSAYLFSKEPYFELFTIYSLEPGGRKGWDVNLLDRKTRVEYSLTLSSQYMHESFPWKEGDVVCAKGRTSFFGAIIEDFNAGECVLEGFRLNKSMGSDSLLPRNYEINGVRLTAVPQFPININTPVQSLHKINRVRLH